jgi:acetyl-CoA C-acetyltransferase
MSQAESPCIVGWAHSRFGKLAGQDLEDLMVGAAREAMAHAGVAGEDIDAVYVGLFNNGFSRQDFPSSLVMHADPGLRYKPATRLENACATGSAAIHGALDFLRAGRGRLALVVGAEKMTATPGPEVGEILLKASYVKEGTGGANSFVGVFGQITQAYFDRYGDRSEALARIACKNHRNGVDNPYAQMRKDLGFEFCNQVSPGNPYVAAPLRRTDCSPVSDGAAAIVLADGRTAKAMRRAVAFRAAVQVNEYLPIGGRDMTRFDGAALAWQKGLREAGIGLLDLDLVETHDCFTIAELIEYEAMGLTPVGQGRVAIEEGWVEKEGKLPVNPSGGLKAKGHPIGATGVSMHVLAAMQATGSAGAMQIPNATRVGVFNMGGAAVANYLSLLERVS